MIDNTYERMENEAYFAEPWWLKKLAAANGVHGVVSAALGLDAEDMDALALKEGKKEIKKQIEMLKKQSNEKKAYEDLTHQQDLAPTINNKVPKLSQPLEEMNMILDALFGHSENPTVLATLARGLEVVLQTLSMKAFAKKKDFNKGNLHASFDLNEKGQLPSEDPKMSHPLLSFICTRLEFPEEIKGLKNYIRELESFIQLQLNTDEPCDSQPHNSHASKGISSSK